MSFLTFLPYFFTGAIGEGTDPDPDPETGTPIGVIFTDNFPGSSLHAGWVTPVGASHTIAVASNKVRVTGTDTSNNGVRKITRAPYYSTSGYHTAATAVSTLRTIDIYTDITIGSYGTSGSKYGPYIGARSTAGLTLNSSLFGRVNFETNKLQLLSGDGSDVFSTIIEATITPTLNLAHTYKLTLVLEGTAASLTFLNNTTAETQSINFDYEFTSQTYGASPLKPLHPSAYRTCFGVSGTSDVYFTNFGCSSTELKNTDLMIGGDSIPFKYMAGTEPGIAELLIEAATVTATSGCGPGMGVGDLYFNIPEIIARNPTNYLGLIGTNNSGDFNTGFLQLYDPTVGHTSVETELVAAGIITKWLSVPNGGNPATSGTYNYKLGTIGAGKHVDVWSSPNGWNTMGIGTGMADSIHPDDVGSVNIANKAIAALPAFFT